MAKYTLLNNSSHLNTRIITQRGAKYGENIHFIPVIADELANLIVDYPVCLMRENEAGQFGLYAILGFEPGENLYLQDNNWDATYIPLHVRRQPFMLGIQPDEKEGSSEESIVITIDMDSKRVSDHEGEALFKDDGSNTPFLENIRDILTYLMRGRESTKAFITQLNDLELIESAQLDITFPNGEKKSFDGLYTINQEKLNQLSGYTLEQFNKKGYLQASYLLTSSIGHFNKLLNRKDKANSSTNPDSKS